MIELAMWERLVTIHECSTLSKAAEKLYITQSALSRSMQKLEDQLDVKLFVHNKNNIIFTKTGELAVIKAKEYLTQNDKIVNELQQFYRNNFLLSFGSTSIQPIWDIQRILKEQNIKLEKDYVMRSHTELIQKVLDDELSLTNYIFKYFVQNNYIFPSQKPIICLLPKVYVLKTLMERHCCIIRKPDFGKI